MTTHEFIGLLERHPDLPLLFDADGSIVEPGYHVTEIKSVTIHAMDCGGAESAWRETVLQVWPDERPEGRHMPVGKFLAIYRRVAERVQLAGDAQVRVEYGNAGEPAITYLVDAVELNSEGLSVRLTPPAVACKAADRSVGDIPVLARTGTARTGDCCAPAADAAVGTAAASCC